MVQESNSPVDLVLHAVSNHIRRTMITNLRESEMRFSQLLTACGLNYDHDAGHFAYHLSELIKRRVVEKRGEIYTLTDFGSKVAEMLELLEAEGSYLFEEKRIGGLKDMDRLELEVECQSSLTRIRSMSDPSHIWFPLTEPTNPTPRTPSCRDNLATS